jgi:hypothetical protein
MLASGYVFKRQSLFFLPGLEVERARRYQNYLSLPSLTFVHLDPSIGKYPEISLKTLANLVKDELRDSDIAGRDGGRKVRI